MTREQLHMLIEIMELQFTVHELVLFLDTHPQSREALEDHNKYANQLRDLKMEYQREYGPIVAYHPTQKPWECAEECGPLWEYISTPWPWQIDYSY
ncbi:spore coat protein CotJB [Selenihalanaerobacter shriftii]|uniref:Spore coat protein JB n=1 Tax=Selenihalanaerobacter shriftii TaxID=142842 RepID=A0A1T4JK38_9FIRM|nr:spore coat protein CotJB [Selenihalanaerobacter shriftii]SJZ30488.1 spore coat protein JB [Selenihalanaerobacter shriftii]